jgi:hypothetical protein
MKTVFIAVALLSAGSAQAESFYRCDRFNPMNTYEVAIDTATGQAKFTGNKAPAVLNFVGTPEANASVLEFQAPEESAFQVAFNQERLEATVSTIDLYGNREEIGEGVCQQVEAL